MKHTKVYRRDIPRTHASDTFGKNNDQQWDNNLAWLENNRSHMAKQARKGETLAAYYYNIALEALREVGGRVDDFARSGDDWWGEGNNPAQRAADMQRLTTRLSQTFNPEEKKSDGGGGGESTEGRASKPAPAPHKKDADGDDKTPMRGGGGKQTYAEADDASLFYAVRYLITKLAEHDDFSDTVPFGHTRWDAKRVLSAYWDPLLLAEAKQDYARQVDDIYLILDTSGSVDHLAKNIAAIAAGAAGIVHLYTGTEARPHYKVRRSTPLRTPRDPFPEWQEDLQEVVRNNADDEHVWLDAFYKEHHHLYPEWAWGLDSFEIDLAWFLYKEKPPKNSRILFWGDTQYAYIGCPRLFAALLRPYRPAWLLSEPYEESWQTYMQQRFDEQRLVDSPGHLSSPEWPKLQAVGIPVVENIQTAEQVRGMFQTLQLLR